MIFKAVYTSCIGLYRSVLDDLNLKEILSEDISLSIFWSQTLIRQEKGINNKRYFVYRYNDALRAYLGFAYFLF